MDVNIVYSRDTKLMINYSFSLLWSRNGEGWVKLRQKFHKKMLVPVYMKQFYPAFSDVAVDAVELLKSTRDENSIVKDVYNSVLGRWALECKCFIF